MRDWPSIVPAASEEFYIVVNHYGRFGSAFAETDINRADYETAVADLISGQHSDPLRLDQRQHRRHVEHRDRNDRGALKQARQPPSLVPEHVEERVDDEVPVVGQQPGEVAPLGELGDRLGVPVPATRAMYACARFLDDARAAQRAPRTEVGVR